MRIALGLEYIGTSYSGWQSHPETPEIVTIQGTVERALAAVADHPIHTVCAGRTDAGVHACGQVIHCDVSAVRSDHAWVFGTNTNLPNDIRILWAKEVPVEFDARRSALHRHYQYILYNDAIRPGLLNQYVTWHYHPLDAELMHKAAQYWIGAHDFTSFRAHGCQSLSPVRELISFQVRRSNQLVIFDIIANAFLYHMVRNMVGALLLIGGGKRPSEWAKEVLFAKDRTKAGVTAPAQGLYLVGVRYPEWVQCPEPKSKLWFINQG